MAFRRQALFTSLYITLCLSIAVTPRNYGVASAAPARPPPPTKAQIKAEVNNMARNISKKYPDYAQYANSVRKYINLALSSKYDFSALKDATILIPSTKAAKELNKKVPANSKNIPKLYNITAYHIIAKKYSVPQLRNFASGQKLATQLRQPLFKIGAKGGKLVQFANRAARAAKPWPTIRLPGMYVGKYFVAHGVDALTIPVGTKV